MYAYMHICVCEYNIHIYMVCLRVRMCELQPSTLKEECAKMDTGCDGSQRKDS